jgi:predicted ester cyclase
MGIPASGRHVTGAGIVISRIVNGKIQEEWECLDELGLLQQLGVVAHSPAPTS